MVRIKKRIVVCSKCGSLYDLHYIDNVKIKGEHIEQFECKHCGYVDVVYSNQIKQQEEA